MKGRLEAIVYLLLLTFLKCSLRITFFTFILKSGAETAAVTMFLSHLLVLVLNCYLGASSARTVKRSSGPSPADPFSDVPEDLDPVSQHMLKLYERYTREHRLKDGNTVRGFRAAGQGV